MAPTFGSDLPEPCLSGGSGSRSLGWTVFDSDVPVTVGNGVSGLVVPASMDGWTLTDMTASVYAPGTTGSMDLQLRRSRAGADQDVLSTKVTLGSGEYTASDGVIDLTFAVLQTGDLLYLDRDSIHTVAALGLSAVVTAEP